MEYFKIIHKETGAVIGYGDAKDNRVVDEVREIFGDKYKTEFVPKEEYIQETMEANMMCKVNENVVRNLLNDMAETFAIKNKKYGNSFEVSLDKYGLIAALTRMSDKFNRMENLILTNDRGTEDETILDTLLDLANYCVMTAAYIENKGN